MATKRFAQNLELRLSADEWNWVIKAAKLQKMPIDRWVQTRLRWAAKREIHNYPSRMKAAGEGKP